MLYSDIDERVTEIAEYVATTGATVRDAARLFGVSKSTVHKDLTGRLKEIAPQLYEVVGLVLARNRAERHIRGGTATRLKYEAVRGKTTALCKTETKEKTAEKTENVEVMQLTSNTRQR